MTQRGRRLTVTVAALTLATSARHARSGEVDATEERAFRWFNDLPDRLAAPTWAVMQAGSFGAVFAAAGVTAWRRDSRTATIVATVGSAVWIGAKAVKPLVRRGRPDDLLDDVTVRGAPQSGLGYPSGHAAVALALGLLATNTCRARAAALGIAGATGAARMYVGAHLPLDVVGGLAIGALAGTATSSALDTRAPR